MTAINECKHSFDHIYSSSGGGVGGRSRIVNGGGVGGSGFLSRMSNG